MNNFTFSGNIGKDARLGNAGGTAVANFSVAVKSGFGSSEKTKWRKVSQHNSRPLILSSKQRKRQLLILMISTTIYLLPLCYINTVKWLYIQFNILQV